MVVAIHLMSSAFLSLEDTSKIYTQVPYTWETCNVVQVLAVTSVDFT